MNWFKNIRFVFALALLMAMIQSPVDAAAPSSCDPDFGEVLKSHAWMAASREVETAQRLIVKPDSVLQYSCFPAHLSAAAGFRSFNSNSPDYRGGPPQYADSIVTVGAPYDIYVSENFNYAAGANTTSIVASTCYSMNAVWTEIKCRDFNKADFVTYEELAGGDRRVYPQPCSAASAQARAGLWGFNLQVANPPPSYPAVGGSIERSPSQKYYLELMSWSDGTCGAPIPTGVIKPDGSPDSVCSMPGCTFTGSTCR